MSRYLSAEESHFINDALNRYYDAPRPYMIEQGEFDDAAPSIPIPRYRECYAGNYRERSRKRASLPVASSKTSFYRSADSIISKRTSIQADGKGLVYRSEFETVPTLTKTPWELERHNKRIHSASSQRAPAVQKLCVFKPLPKDVYSCILQQLEILHFGTGSNNCTTCYLRDIYNVALVSRAWDKAARAQLYSSLWIPAPDHNENKWALGRRPGRLKLLRKTLRDRNAFAKLVREIKTSDLQQIFLQSGHQEQQDIINDLASIVMSCPNLERLVGFHLVYNHDFNRLNHALSTRQKLKERAWIIGRPIDDQTFKATPAFDLYPGPTELFLHHHDHCSNLKTLFLHGQSAGIMNYRSFVGTFRKLGNLENLHISNFSADDFNDRTLAALPTLKSLRLEDLPGITDKGLSRFAASAAAKSIHSLSLIRQEVIDLLVLTAFFTNLPTLSRFTITQDSSPGVHPGIHIRRPVFASPTLHFLHWDVLIPGPATHELSISMQLGALPALRRVRAPSDHDGLLQHQCRPRARVTNPADDAMEAQIKEQMNGSEHYLRSLPAARRAAQDRIDEAPLRRKPAMKIVVQDERGEVRHVYSVAAFMGTVGSRVEYWLEPDVEGSEEAVVEVEDLMGWRGAREGEGDVCVGGAGGGRSSSGGGSGGTGRKGGEWCHAPRRRGRVVEVRDFF